MGIGAELGWAGLESHRHAAVGETPPSRCVPARPHTRLLAQDWGRADAPGAFLTAVPISFGWQTRRTSPRAVTVLPRRAPLR
jgi:hypothetical protein